MQKGDHITNLPVIVLRVIEALTVPYGVGKKKIGVCQRRQKGAERGRDKEKRNGAYRNDQTGDDQVDRLRSETTPRAGQCVRGCAMGKLAGLHDG